MKEIKDPRITQYLLNEMTDSEKSQFEQEMNNNPELKQMVEDLNVLTDTLKSELSSQELPTRHVEDQKIGESMFSLKKLMIITVPLATAAAAVLIFKNIGTIEELGQMPPEVATIKVDPNSNVKEAEKKQPRPETIAPNKPQAKNELVAENQARPESVAYDEDSLADMEAPAGSAGLVAREAQIAPSPAKRGRALKKKMVGNSYGFGGLGTKGAPRDTYADTSAEGYDSFQENIFKKAMEEPLSTFSIDVDTASYSNMRRFITRGQTPPKDSVRLEEMINYFKYNYPAPTGKTPFSVSTELTETPWNKKHHLLRIGLKGKDIDWSDRKNSNLVFLLDVSGSMNDPNKLPLVKQGIKLMVENMNKQDRVAIVVYAGSSGLVLPSTKGTQKEEIMAALDRLSAGGSTNGGAGIQLAYKVAKENFIKGGINRVILATDGDFNVGTTNRESLIDLIKAEAKSNVFLTVLGFGTGNLKDSQMEQIANKGNGQYAYIDSYREAKKVMVDQIGGTLVTIAKDVKIQVEFNPGKVAGYRLVGYENRKLNKEDFNDDKKDAGEIGAGHTVTALYEIIPAGMALPTPKVDDLKYQKPKAKATKEDAPTNTSDEWLTVKLRYKTPEGSKSTKLEVPVKGDVKRFDKASTDTRFASTVAGFGMLLRDSDYSGDMTVENILEWAKSSKGSDSKGYRQEFIELVDKYKNSKNK